MEQLPSQYKWLLKEGAPKMLVEALRHHGTLETAGKGNNPNFFKWAKEVGGKVADIYTADEIPWCGLFVAMLAKRSGYEMPKEPLWALNWNTFGEKSCEPMLGDVLVFVRKTSTGATAGHVGIYVGEDATAFHVLGGNQSDKVCITRILKSRLYGARRPVFKIAAPKNIRKVYLSASGKVSANEA